jgi:hypothetical protein
MTISWPSAALADDEQAAHGSCGELGVDLWGLSNHLHHRDADYNDRNIGAGLRCYERPDWRLLGRSQDNRTFLQIDALVDSHRGLLVPVSLGAEYLLRDLPDGCKLFAEGALTFSYYGSPTTSASGFRWGPVPGLVFGCGRVKANMMFVPSPSREVLAAIAASVTITLKKKT